MSVLGSGEGELVDAFSECVEKSVWAGVLLRRDGFAGRDDAGFLDECDLDGGSAEIDSDGEGGSGHEEELERGNAAARGVPSGEKIAARLVG